jgi:outer membrane cobalamin receptor
VYLTVSVFFFPMVSFGQNTNAVSTKNRSVEAELADTLGTAVVTASAKPSATRQSAPLQVMAKSDFEKLGIKELHQAVKTFSGVQIKDYGGIGGVKTVSVRSMGSQHTAISYDGVTISNAQSGQVDIGRFNLDNVEYITLSIGQQDDIFQSARMFASAGVLNIRTARPLFDGKKVNVGSAVNIASFNTWNPSLYWQQKLSGRWALAVNADWLSSDGEYPFTLVNGTVVTKEKRLNSDVNTIRAEANIYGDLAKGGQLSFKGNWMSSQRGLPGSVVLYNNDARERLWDEAAFVQGHYRKSFGTRWEMQGQLKYNYAWNKYRDEKEYYPGGEKVDYYTQQELYGSASVKYQPVKDVQLVLSQDVFRNTLDASYANFVYPVRFTSLTALAGKYSNGRFTVTASLLSTFITENVERGDAAPNRFRVSPAASVSYKLSEERNIRIRASYQDMFRTPTFNDLYYNEMGNKVLNPEIARQFNVGVTWREGFSGIVDEVSLQADGYYNKVKDKIVALPTLFVWKMMNLGEVDILGTDVNIGTALSFGAGMRMKINGSWSCQYAVDVTSPTDKNYRHQIPYTPRNSGSLSVSFLNKWVDVGYLMNGVGERYSLPQNTESNRIGGYVEHSASLGRSFEMDGCSIALQLECQNFTDVQYEVIQYYPMAGRSYRITLKVNF